MSIDIKGQQELSGVNLTALKTKSKSAQGTENFADYFQKGNVKHLDGAKYAMAPNGDVSKNSYFRMSKDGVSVQYNNVTFFCNYETGALELGNCSKPSQCIRVPLERGGSLLFNPDSISGINEAIGMFSAEDQGRIMRAIEMYNMAKDKLEELEEDENAEPNEKVSESTGDDMKDKVDRGSKTNEDDQVLISKDYMTVLKERTSKYEIYDVLEAV